MFAILNRTVERHKQYMGYIEMRQTRCGRQRNKQSGMEINEKK